MTDYWTPAKKDEIARERAREVAEEGIPVFASTNRYVQTVALPRTPKPQRRTIKAVSSPPLERRKPPTSPAKPQPPMTASARRYAVAEERWALHLLRKARKLERARRRVQRELEKCATCRGSGYAGATPFQGACSTCQGSGRAA
jgi:hypothetical protein